MSTRQVSKFFLLFSVLTQLVCFSSFAQGTSYKLVYQVDLKNALVSPYKNVIKLYDVAVDEVRARAYTSGSHTPYVAVIDIEAHQEVGSITLPFRHQLNTLSCNPANGYLLAIPCEKTPNELYAIDPSTSQQKGKFTSSGKIAGIGFDPSTNRIFVGDENIVRVLNGENLALVASIPAGFPIGDIQMDVASRTLYVTSLKLSGGKAVVKLFSASPPYSLQRTIEVPSPVALGGLILDVPNDRLFLLGIRTVKVVRISSGVVVATYSTGEETSVKVYSSSQDRLYMNVKDGYSEEGQGGSWGKIYMLNPTTGAMDSMKMGDGPARIAIDNSRSVLVVPSMHSANVELYNLQTGHDDTVDVGETADEFALSPDHVTLYIVERLGGSRIFRYDITTHGFSEMRAGNWPCVAEVDSALGKLFVLNEFQSSMGVFDCATNQLVKTIRLSIPEARTDAIPVMHYDKVNQKLYAGFPEFGKICVVNAKTVAEEAVFSIPGFHFDSEVHAAIGVIQIAAVPAHQKLFVVQEVEKKLKVFDLITFALLDSVDLQPIWSSNPFQNDMIAYDAVHDRLFLGNKAVSPVNYAVLGTLPLGQRFVGYNPSRTILYSIAVNRDTVALNEHSPTTLQLLARRELFVQSGSATPVFYHDELTNDLFIAEFDFAVLRHYDLDVITSVEEPTPITPGKFVLFQNYPNPFNPTTTIRFSLPQREHVTLQVFDVLGREVATLVDGELNPGEHSVVHNPKGLASGVYFYRLSTPTFSQTKSMEVIK